MEVKITSAYEDCPTKMQISQKKYLTWPLNLSVQAKHKIHRIDKRKQGRSEKFLKGVGA